MPRIRSPRINGHSARHSGHLITLASILAVGTAALAPGSALASAKKATHVTLPALTVVTPGTSEGINGRLTRGNGYGVGAERVTLSFRPTGSRSFGLLGTATTRSNGRFTFYIAPTANGTVMVSFAGTRSLRASSAIRPVGVTVVTRPAPPQAIAPQPAAPAPDPTTTDPSSGSDTANPAPPTDPPSGGAPQPPGGSGNQGGSVPPPPPPPPLF
jgi:hypothetical protein